MKHLAKEKNYRVVFTMPVYNYPLVSIGNLAKFKASLLISDKISCRVYDSTGSTTNRCREGGIYNLVIKQEVQYGELRVDLAVYETADNDKACFALSYGNFGNNVRGLYYNNPDLDNPWAVDKWEEEEVLLLWGMKATSQRAVPKHIPVTVFNNLDFCELLILFNGGYVVIQKEGETLDDAGRKKIANLHDALTMLTGR
jgi:hypothetical protein